MLTEWEAGMIQLQEKQAENLIRIAELLQIIARGHCTKCGCPYKTDAVPPFCECHQR